MASKYSDLIPSSEDCRDRVIFTRAFGKTEEIEMAQNKNKVSSFRQPPRALKPEEIDRVAGAGYILPGHKSEAGPDNQSRNMD
jgi:hypothetical protein